MLFKGLVTILACDLFIAIIAIPLILRKVPRNVVYGFRTRATLDNDSVWYEANAYFGRGILLSSLVSMLVIVFLYFSNLFSPLDYLKASIAALAVPPVVPVLLTCRYISSIAQSNQRGQRDTHR
jgi:uncharacterized membrane protein